VLEECITEEQRYVFIFVDKRTKRFIRNVYGWEVFVA
jgi:hypothetical protein